MRHRFHAVNIFLAAGLLLTAGLAIGAGEARADNPTSPAVSTIGKQVQRKLSTLPWYGVFDNIQFQVNGSTVTLSGQVLSEHSITKYDAQNDVERIPGVTKVINHIEVLPPSMFDNQIRREEFRTIFSQSDLGRYTMGAIPQVHIIVKNGHVTLEGVVMNQMDKTMAGIAANTVPNVFSVTNNLRIG
ncbi:MAG: BON domain-containing protein [Candidatus Acidiferrales bacterium]